ncbi:helix-turn-helix domain-containing protein [Saccharopolyspora phatthalungensis]|uniref:Transcriptional regulator with XRE-family HTH domain n=1 Tax=Saccharopolyspora phatthalungensis TaxID=664693 RepID=A0A840Q2E4_9PSEU|nr:XRE family transcriptional regulator [Saccharopolyspora phatthalungensis]MBB5154167.1 transcriptional regulator with XRE-family HTH domain [Saccharopolyspora phatthalungensis]
MSEAPGDEQALALAGLGDRIRRLRGARGLDQAELAEQAALDVTHLVNVEHGDTTPSLAVLARLATALDVELSELLTDTKPGPAVTVLRGNEVPTVDTEGMALQVLTPRAVVPGLYAARYRISPTGDGVRPVQHEGHDWLYVLSGQLHVEFDQGATTLSAGDSVSFSARVPHRLSALGEEPAELLAVGATLPASPRGDLGTA